MSDKYKPRQDRKPAGSEEENFSRGQGRDKKERRQRNPKNSWETNEELEND